MPKPCFIVDESVDYPLVPYLRSKGYRVIAIAEDFPSLDDKEILDKAYQQESIVITNDKDFGELIFRHNLKSKGVILLRLHDQSSTAKINTMKALLEKYQDRFYGSFIVASPFGIRIRKLL